jgi:hypothetical protein
MKKLLFLVGCVLLLLPALAGPAAADKIQWQVFINIHSPSDPPLLLRLNETQMTWRILDKSGRLFSSVPAEATDVRVGSSTPFVTLGNTEVFAKSFFQRMTVSYVVSRHEELVIASCDESTSQSYYGEPYLYNDWTGDVPGDQIYPYNPNIGTGIWTMDWMVPLLPRGNTAGATLDPGKYTIDYTDMLLHRCADPMFPGRVPGKEGYPPNGGPWDWWYPAAHVTFTVR